MIDTFYKAIDQGIVFRIDATTITISNASGDMVVLDDMEYDNFMDMVTNIMMDKTSDCGMHEALHVAAYIYLKEYN